MPGTLETYGNQTLRLIVHTSTAGSRIRITVSNLYGTVPLTVGEAHIAVRSDTAKIVPMSDRTLHFQGHMSFTIPAHAEATSDPVDLPVPPLVDLAVSLYLPTKVEATTSHLLALQTSYVAEGNSSGATELKVSKTIDTWPFLTRVEVNDAEPRSAVAIIGNSTTDGDGSSRDKNRRWPDVLAGLLQQAGRPASYIGVLNEGIIRNRLLKDSPHGANAQRRGSRASTYWSPQTGHGVGGKGEGPFGAALGEATLSRLDRDGLNQPGVRYLVVVMGVNDISFPGAFSSPTETVTPENLITGFRQIIRRAHRRGIRVLLATIAPFENANYTPDNSLVSYTSEKEAVRQRVNEWIRSTKEADGVADFDSVLRDPTHPSRLLARFDSGDHIHANDAGYRAIAEAFPLAFFMGH
jgi:lysophospholipase L1-like esterase